MDRAKRYLLHKEYLSLVLKVLEVKTKSHQ